MAAPTEFLEPVGERVEVEGCRELKRAAATTAPGVRNALSTDSAAGVPPLGGPMMSISRPPPPACRPETPIDADPAQNREARVLPSSVTLGECPR
jgi:hypothetical protein